MQEDLFDWAARNDQKFKGGKPNFLEKIRFTLRLDQVIGFFIILLVTHVFIFALGIEKGKVSSTDNLFFESIKPVALLAKASTVSPKVLEETTEVEEKKVLPSIPKFIEVEEPSEVSKIEIEIVTDLPEEPKIKVNARPSGNYTIQHVTYITQSAATREMSKLSSLGYNSFVIKSGKYFLICVNAFENRRDALRTLCQLRNQGIVASDAYVRPLA